jgi:hypothetical protein
MSDPNVSFKRTIKSKLDLLPIVEGQMTFVKDTQELYFDMSSSVRTKSTDIVELDTEDERINLVTPINDKIYFVHSTRRFWLYTNLSWQIISGEGASEPIVETLTVTTDGQTEFELSDVPSTGKVNFSINGVNYSQDTEFSLSNKTLTWLFTKSNNGFDLETSDLIEARY